MYVLARFLNRLRAHQFAVTVEIDPPKGPDPQTTLNKVRQFADRVDAVNVADCPMANVRMSPITLAHLIQRDAGVEAIFHLTCRDRNIIGLQAELLGAAGLGVRNILAIRGDEPARGDHPFARGVFEVDTVGLIRLATTLNRGYTVSGQRLAQATDFAIGCTANPGAADLEAEVSRLEEKVAAGAHFIQTQPVFDIRSLERWLSKISGRIAVPVLCGILPLKSCDFALKLREKVPGILVPDKVINRMRTSGDAEGFRITGEILKAICTQFRAEIAGVHVFPLNNTSCLLQVLDILEEFGVSRVSQERALTAIQ